MAGLVDALLEDLVRHVTSTIKSSITRASSSASTSGTSAAGGTVASLPPLPPLPTTAGGPSGGGGGGGGGRGPGLGAAVAGTVAGTVAASVGMRGGEIAKNIASLPSIQQAVDFQLATSQSRAFGVAPTIQGVQAVQRQIAAKGTALSPADVAVATQQAGLFGMSGQNMKAYSSSVAGISNLMPGLGVAAAGSSYMSMQQAPNVNALRLFGVNMRNLQTGKASDINSVINQIWSMLSNTIGRSPTTDDIEGSLLPGGFLDKFIKSYGGDSNMQQALIQALLAKAGGAKNLSKKELKRIGLITPGVEARSERTEAQLSNAQKATDALVSGFTAGTKVMTTFTNVMGKVIEKLDWFLQFRGFVGAVGTKAEGGAVGGSTSYIVGERGPELFVPSSDGYIIPNHDLPENMRRITYREKGGPVKKDSTKIGPIKHASGEDLKKWATAVLARMGAPVSESNLYALGMWAQREGGWKNNDAAYNPLNTTLKTKGSWSVPGNEPGVKGYPNLAAGVDATVKTLLNSNKAYKYDAIVSALRGNKGTAEILKAINASAWRAGANEPSNYDWEGVKPPWKAKRPDGLIVPPTSGSSGGSSRSTNPIVSAAKAVANAIKNTVGSLFSGISNAVTNPISSFFSALTRPAPGVAPQTQFSNTGPFQIYGGGMSEYIKSLGSGPNYSLTAALSKESDYIVRPRKSGGDTKAGKSYLVGEVGPEVHVTKESNRPTYTFAPKPKEQPTTAVAAPAQTVNYGGVKIEIVVPANFTEEKMVREIQRALTVSEITRRARVK